MSTEVNEVLTEGELDWLVWHLSAHEWVCFDLETISDVDHEDANLQWWHPSSRIVSASFTVEEGSAWVVPISHPAGDHDLDDIARLFEALQGSKLVGHNLKYDVLWVRAILGVDLTPYMTWDTLSGAMLLGENRKLRLKSIAVMELGVEPWDDVDLDDAERVPWADLSVYNAKDTDYTWQLCLQQRDKLRRKKRLGRLKWHVLRRASRALADAQYNGMLLDRDRSEELREHLQDIADDLYDKLEAQTPEDLRAEHQNLAPRLFDVEPVASERLSWAPTSNFFLAYAARHWPIIRCGESCECQYGDKPHPHPTWNASVLKELTRRGHDDAKMLLDRRKADKLLSTYLNRWPSDQDGRGRIHTTFWQTRTKTGRLSSSDPNLQQVPTRGKFKLKPAFVAPDGWQFCEVDHSQIEVRIVAHVSGDENLIDVYRTGRDVYIETAARIYEKDQSEVTADERQRTKPVVLGFLYGMGAQTFVDYALDNYDMVFTVEEAQHVRETFFDLFPRLREWHEKSRRQVRAHGRVKSPAGWIRRLPDGTGQDQDARVKAELQGINAPVQNLASVIMQLALADLYEQLDPDVCRMVGTVHDSTLLEIRNGHVEEVVDQVAEIMLNPPLHKLGCQLAVPLSVEFEIGPRWGEVELEIEREGSLAMAA